MLKNIYTLVIVDDLSVIKEFYTQALGFNVVFDSDWYIQLENHNLQIAFMIENASNQPSILHKKFNGQGLVITLEYEDVDEFYKDFPRKDAIIQDLKTEEWGQRHFFVKDPADLIIDVVGFTTPDDY